MNFYFIKKPSLLRDGIQELLKRRFNGSHIICCNQFNHEEINEASIILIDVNEALTKLADLERLHNEGIKIVLWIEELASQEAKPLFKLGLEGYLYYDIDEDTLVQALKFIQEGKRYVSPFLGGMLIDVYRETHVKKPNPPLDLLSRREWEVLQLLVKGYNNVQIADELFLSDKTVKNYVSSILHKLHVPDRTNAVIKALKKQWLYL
ncbi:helix-turn-helix transcriptional regulator [Halolactibacillus alkaliphilus]|nr:response regulator transcription factor [Halolactibacillus alkaliphilus]SFO65879.1 regulatory protein, luxR family [Halolactibacillus alkaliphilus]